ncbi:hypothetical protein IMSHALPRED_005149 [Imshaugia aleurites]|uniref:Major facilitator superfamily (MFS) profile domain-containing protein n=1 Tax=Imshaugia aleurites TaxID=172621 RepID=A0A8H3F9R5_9LECA|nr:hypothetical protein IMSHALPRED_005149 [Imshaugia aleurites]
MVKDFHVGDRSSASFWAGIFISSFALAEALTGMAWGGVSDRIGRKPVLLIGCAGTLISLLIVGFSTNFWLALAGRTLGGLLNGNIGVIQTMVGELVKKPEHEPRAFSVMPFVWSIGTIIGPAIGGTFARPAISMPSVFSPTGVFAHFPYLLPNLICAAILLISISFGYFFLVETHPDMQPWSTQAELDHTTAETPLMTAGATADYGVDLRADTYGTFNTVDISETKEWTVNADGSSRSASISMPKVFTRKVAMIVVALGIFTYHSMTYDHLLPIFLQDNRISTSNNPQSPFNIPGGLGLTIQSVGIIMSINGVIALFTQAILFPLFASWLGVWKTFVMVTVLHPVAYFIVPYLAFLPESSLYPGIYVCLAIRNFFCILAYPVLLILLKEAAPSPSVLGKVNGLAASAGAACRTISPPIAGYLYGVGTQIGFTGLAWWCSGAVAIVGAFQILLIQRTKNKTATVRPMARFMRNAMPAERDEDVVHITLRDVDEV